MLRNERSLTDDFIRNYHQFADHMFAWKQSQKLVSLRSGRPISISRCLLQASIPECSSGNGRISEIAYIIQTWSFPLFCWSGSISLTAAIKDVPGEVRTPVGSRSLRAETEARRPGCDRRRQQRNPQYRVHREGDCRITGNRKGRSRSSSQPWAATERRRRKVRPTCWRTTASMSDHGMPDRQPTRSRFPWLYGGWYRGLHGQDGL